MRSDSQNPEKIRWRSWRRALLVALASLSAAVAAVAPASAVAWGGSELQPLLARAASVTPARSVAVIVQFKRGVSEARAEQTIRALGGQITGTVPFINAVGATLPASAAGRLGHSRLVRNVSDNAPVRSQSAPFNPFALFGPIVATNNLQTTYPGTVYAPQTWNQERLTGFGVGVAVIDTGVDGNLPDFQTSSANSTSRVIASAVVDPSSGSATDGYGHGTMVAGIIAGNGLDRASSDPLYGQYVGIAPAANLISIKVGDNEGNASLLDVIDGIEFAIAHQAAYNIRVINLSLESTVAESYLTDPLDAAVESAWDHGIVVVVSAGNLGTASDAVDFSPGNDPYVITVGATDDQGTTSQSGDTVASWSSQGTTQDGFSEPNVYAPGASVTSTLAPGSVFSQLCPSCIVGGQYITAGGTSFAAPVVSGAVADMLQAHPLETPDQVKAALMATANPLASDPAAREIAIDQAVNWIGFPADQGLTPSTLLDGLGNLIGSLSGWTQTTWQQATGSLAAGWARSSWSCATCEAGSGVTESRSSWSRSSWSAIWSN